MNHTIRSLIAGAILVSIPFRLHAAEVVYDNSGNDLSINLNPGSQEIGDEIQLDGTARWLSEFSFEYWGNNSESLTEFAGNVEARIRFYLNDGPAYPDVDDAFIPSTVFYDTGSFSVAPTARGTLAFTDFVTGTVVPLTGPLPDAFTWSVQFSGLGATDTAGVTVYSPPTIGNNFDDYWIYEAGSWTLLTNNLDSIDFAARITADVVPEPSALWLGLCGGVIATAAGWRTRFKQRGAPKNERALR